MSQKLFEIGQITSLHSFKGEIKVWVSDDYRNLFTDLASLFINNQEYQIEKCQAYKSNSFYLKLAGINDEKTARAMVGEKIKLPIGMRPPLDQDEYLVEDLIGMVVRSTDGQWEGVLKAVLPYPANDVYVLEKDGKEFLIPAVKDIIISVNLHNNTMMIDPALGML